LEQRKQITNLHLASFDEGIVTIEDLGSADDFILNSDGNTPSEGVALIVDSTPIYVANITPDLVRILDLETEQADLEDRLADEISTLANTLVPSIGSPLNTLVATNITLIKNDIATLKSDITTLIGELR